LLREGRDAIFCATSSGKMASGGGDLVQESAVMHIDALLGHAVKSAILVLSASFWVLGLRRKAYA
jgi:hypothetical protein